MVSKLQRLANGSPAHAIVVFKEHANNMLEEWSLKFYHFVLLLAWEIYSTRPCFLAIYYQSRDTNFSKIRI
jgi:hypothetical protein